MVLVTMVVASLAALLASSLPGMSEWAVIQWIKMEEQMELIELWTEEVQGFDYKRTSHKDLLSALKSMVIEGCLVVVDVQVKADFMAAASSS